MTAKLRTRFRTREQETRSAAPTLSLLVRSDSSGYSCGRVVCLPDPYLEQTSVVYGVRIG
jgi:hypothetical protein